MWWSCFSCDKKGPYHIWKAEARGEKAAMTKDLNKRNKARYESNKALWGLVEDGIERIHIDRNQPGPRAKFVHDEHTGAYVVKVGRGGINWYRYQEKVFDT
jgi:hypothetical protein